MKMNVLLLISGATVALMGCGSDSASGFDELYAQGLTKYVDKFDPSNQPEPVERVKTYEFAVPSDPAAEPRGPLCLRGAGYSVDTREGASDQLIIFLQGGGACWDTFCSASSETGPLTASGILNPELEGNPVADWDVVYLPYCDGSLFAGDVDRILPPFFLGGEETESSMGYQRGLQNLSAGLDIAAEEFPNPTRILLTGVSAGAFGTITALPLVRYYYPDTEIVLFNDSGVGVGNENDPDFINETLIAGWNATAIVPESCPECTANGHATGLIEWQLAADDNFTMSALSFSADAVIANFFLMVNPASFTAWLLTETERTTMMFEDRYKRLIPAGDAHTTLLRETSEGGTISGFAIGSLEDEVAGVTVLEWFTAMIEGTEEWVDLVDESVE